MIEMQDAVAREIQYTMVLPDGFPLLFGAPGDRKARIFAFNWMLEHDVPHVFIIRRPARKDPVPLYHVLIDGSMVRAPEDADPETVPICERGWITRKFVSQCHEDAALVDAELVYERNVPILVERDLGDACGPVSEAWCRLGFVNIEGEVVNGFTLEDRKVGNSFRVWTAETGVQQ